MISSLLICCLPRMVLSRYPTLVSPISVKRILLNTIWIAALRLRKASMSVRLPMLWTVSSATRPLTPQCHQHFQVEDICPLAAVQTKTSTICNTKPPSHSTNNGATISNWQRLQAAQHFSHPSCAMPVSVFSG